MIYRDEKHFGKTKKKTKSRIQNKKLFFHFILFNIAMIICLINKEGVIGGRMVQAIEERKSSLSWYSRYERNPCMHHET